MGGKEKWNYLRRVEKFIEKSGLEDEKITDEELYGEFHRRELEKVWKKIHI